MDLFSTPSNMLNFPHSGVWGPQWLPLTDWLNCQLHHSQCVRVTFPQTLPWNNILCSLQSFHATPPLTIALSPWSICVEPSHMVMMPHHNYSAMITDGSIQLINCCLLIISLCTGGPFTDRTNQCIQHDTNRHKEAVVCYSRFCCPYLRQMEPQPANDLMAMWHWEWH